VQQAGPVVKNEGASCFEAFLYIDDPNAPAESAWEGWGEPASPQQQEGDAAQNFGTGQLEAGLRAEFDHRLTEETRRSFEAGREKGRSEGRQTEREAQSETVKSANALRTRQTIELTETFAKERDRYLQQVEREVVELALAVAARILRREAQMDPLLLTGAVRVALGQLSGSTEVRVRVPAGDLELWKETLAVLPNLRLKPQVTAGDEMRLGDCVIETELGSVDIGIRAQLGEIERGFFDRAGGTRKVADHNSGAPGSHVASMEARV